MRRSIRGTLLFWYAAILVVVVGAYGGTIVVFQRRSMMGELKGKLEAYAYSLAATIELEDDDDDDDEEGDESEGELELDIDRRYFPDFAHQSKDGMYFKIWDQAGNLARRSPQGPKVPRSTAEGWRTRADKLEFSIPGREQTWVLVGHSTREFDAAMAGFLGKVVGTGVAVLAVSLIGGWFLAGRVLEPVRRISTAASEISETNMDRRIDIHDTENELGSLAGTLNAAFDRLQNAVERQKRFTADASHELRTPLSVILVNTEHALSRKRTEEDYEEALAAIDRAGKRMKSLVSVLLSMARADSGQTNISRERVDLADLVDETIDLLEPVAEHRGVVLEKRTMPSEIVANRDLMLEMTTNLISNAVLHNRRGGRGCVSLQREDGAVLMQVEDDGPGISEEDLPHIFERFYRADKARTRASGGTGLGLAITRWIVEQHGGSISVVSEAGKGTTFSVRLPGAPVIVSSPS